jgi:hypothetical protein
MKTINTFVTPLSQKTFIALFTQGIFFILQIYLIIHFVLTKDIILFNFLFNKYYLNIS